MAKTISYTFDDKLIPENVLIVDISVPASFQAGANTISTAMFEKFHVNEKSILSIYRFENPTKWFVHMSAEAFEKHIGKINGTTLHLHQVTLRFSVPHQTTKIILHWVPELMQELHIKQIFKPFMKQGTQITLHKKKKRGDLWSMMMCPNDINNIPHYIILNTKDKKKHKVLDQIAGRPQEC